MGRPPITVKSGKLFERQLERALDYLETNSGGGGGSSSWASITGKPSTFPPEAHTHAQSDVTGLTAALAGKADTGHTHAISDVTGLSTALSGVPVRGAATVTVPNNALEWSQTVAATGVVPADVVIPTLAAHVDADENDAEMLDVMALSAVAGTDQITVTMAFATPTAGAIKINWMAA